MKYYDFDDFGVGSEYVTQFRISEEVAKEFVELTGGNYSINLSLSPSVFLIYTPLFDALKGRFINGTVHLKQEAIYYKKPRVGDNFKVRVSVKDKYIRKNKRYLLYETVYSIEDEVYCKLLSTQLLGLTR